MEDSTRGKPTDESEIYHLLKLVSELGITIRGDADNNVLSSYNKNILPYIMELQPKVEKPAFDSETNYYYEYWKTFISNEILIASLKEISLEKVLMEQKIQEYEKVYTDLEKQVKPRKKKRRTAKEILKNYRVVCGYSVSVRHVQEEVRLQRLAEPAHQEVS